MADFWMWIDALPAWGVLGLIGLLAIGLIFILDVIGDAKEEWK